jgi:YNFM family putative membrane transporter
MGLYIAGNACGGMTGRILTAILADHLPWRGAVAVIGILALILSVLFWLLLPASRHFQRRPFRIKPLSASLVSHLRDPGLLCLFALAFLLMGGFVTLYNYMTFYLLAPPYALSQSQVAMIFLAYAFGAFGSSVMGGLIECYGRARILYSALAIMTTGILFTLAATLVTIVAGIVIFTIGFFGAHAVASAWVGARAPTARAQASSLYLLAYYLGSSISGTGGGFIWSVYGWHGVAGLVIALLMLAGIVILRLTTLSARPAEGPCRPI